MINQLYLYLGIYITALLVFTYYISKKQDEEDFLIGGRNRKGWQILTSKFAAAMGASYFIGYTGFAYEYGLGVLLMVLGLVFGYLLFAYWASPKIHKDSKINKFYTIGDFVYHKTKNKFSAGIADIFSSIILFSWLLVGIIGSAKIINDFGFLSYEIAVVITALVVLSYILIAGYKAVIMTDVIQSGVIIILLIIVTLAVIRNGNISQIILQSNTKFNLAEAFAFFLFGLLTIFSYSDRYQLAYAAKNEKHLKHGIGLAIIPILIVAMFLLLVGLFMAQEIPGLDSGLVFTEALKNFLSPSLLPFVIVLFFAGIMSSADTNIYAIASHYALSKKNKVNSVKTIRNATLIIMVIMTIFALLFRDIVDVALVTGGMSLILSFPMVYLFCGGRKPRKFIASAFCGLIGFFVGFAIFGLEPPGALVVMVGGLAGLIKK